MSDNLIWSVSTGIMGLSLILIVWCLHDTFDNLRVNRLNETECILANGVWYQPRMPGICLTKESVIK